MLTRCSQTQGTDVVHIYSSQSYRGTVLEARRRGGLGISCASASVHFVNRSLNEVRQDPAKSARVIVTLG